MPKTINDITTSAASAANVDLFHIWKSAQSQKITAQSLFVSGLTTKSAAGSAAATGLQVGAATVGLFSGGAGATEYLGLAANGTEHARFVGGQFLMGITTTTAGRVAKLFGGSTELRLDAVGISYPLVVSNTQAAASSTGPGISFQGSGSTTTGQLTASWTAAATTDSAMVFTIRSSNAMVNMLRVGGSGVRIQSGVSAAASDLLHVANTAGTVDILRCSDSLGTVGIGGAPVSGIQLNVASTNTHLRLQNSSTTVRFVVTATTGALTVTSSGGTAAHVTFSQGGSNAIGITRHLTIADSTALALGNGGGLRLDGVTTGYTQTGFAAIKAYKATATDGETGGHLDLYSRANGSNLACNLRVGTSGASLSRAGITTETANASAQFQIDSTTKGFLPPRMTEAQRNAIGTPAAGLVVYNTDTNMLNFYNGSAWGAI